MIDAGGEIVRIGKMRRALVFLPLPMLLVLAADYPVEFFDGYFATRTVGLVAPVIGLLLLPAFVCLLVGGVLLIVALFRQRGRWLALPAVLQVVAWGLILVMNLTDFQPRVWGLLVRARIDEKALLEFHRAYRTGGMEAVAEHEVMGWGVGYETRIQAKDKYVEVWWGSALPKSWGFRIADVEHAEPLFIKEQDARAARATSRITVFLGIW